MTSKLEKEFLIVGIVVGAFIALFYDLFQELVKILISDVHISLIKILSSFLAILISLVILKLYLKSIKKCDNSKNIPEIDKTPVDNSKSKFGKFLESEKNNVIILVCAGIALTFSATPMDLSLKIGSMLIASGLFIWAIFRRAKSNYGIQRQIDELRTEINELKGRSDNNNDSKSNNQ